jgi:hypothetical protein
MIRALLSGLALLGVASAQNSVSVTNCAPGSAFSIQSLSFSPSAPVRGENGTMTTVYTVPAVVDAGTTHYSCVLNGIPVYSETLDLCSQTQCPLTAGQHTDYSISPVPDFSGKLVCTIDWRDTANTELMCIQMLMRLS